MDNPTPPDSEASPGPSDRVSAWTWLADLRERLGPAVELVDPGGTPALPAPRADVGVRVRRLLSPARDRQLLAALQRAASTGELQILSLQGLRLAILAIDDGSGLLLLLGEPVDAGPDAERRNELERFAAWLARALRAQRAAAASEAARDTRELSALHRLLNSAVASGSPREVMRTFVEAMAIWADVDARAYRGDLQGSFIVDIALPGADPSLAPRTLDADPMPEQSSVLRLSPGIAAELGFRPGVEVVLTRVRSVRTAPWIIAGLGAIDARAEARLAVFSEVLVSSVRSAAEVEASRLMWSLVQRLVSDDPSIEKTAVAALSELAQTAESAASLIIRRANGAVVLHATAGIPVAAGTRRDTLRFRLQMPPGLSGVLAIERDAGRPYTVREQHLGEVASSILGPWVSAQVSRGGLSGDRRSGARTLEQEIERRTQGSAVESDPLSLIVFSGEAIRTTPEVRTAIIGEIRRHLRPLDNAGTLATGDIGVFLPSTPTSGARVVISRLCDPAGDPILSTLRSARIGVATRTGRGTWESTVVQEAGEAGGSVG